VNFYKRFIGDIQAKTGGLTLAEFGAYDRLLDHYYSTEKPVPAKDVHRICRAMSASERAAVERVLSEFFELTPEGYAQSKADEQIAKAQPLIEAARANGKKGGRPKKPKTQTEPSGFQNDNPDGTQQKPGLKATQSQSQLSPSDEGEGSRKRSAVPSRPEDVADQTWADWLHLRKTKRAPVSETTLDGAREEAAKAGMPLERFLQIWCRRGSQGLEAAWLRADERKPANGNKHALAARTIFGDQQPDYIDAETN
jgi:uncharacterized protein YdaU (DUF1376 family)